MCFQIEFIIMIVEQNEFNFQIYTHTL